MISKKLLKKWFLLVIVILLVSSPMVSSFSARGRDIKDTSEKPSQDGQDLEFSDLFTVDISRDLSDGVGLGENVIVTVEGKEKPDGTRIEIDGNSYRNPSWGRPVPAMINVTNVLWGGTPWYAEYDDTVWRRNGTDNKYFQRINPYQVRLAIYGETPDGDGYQFPAGCDVSFNLFVGNKTKDEENNTWRNRYRESKEYTYEVEGAFPHKPADYENPNDPDENLFKKNIGLEQHPDNPNIRESVKVNITSESDVRINRASLQLKAVYPNGTEDYYQYFFNPTNESWPSYSAEVTIPEEWHVVPKTTIIYNIRARDPHGHEVVSENHTYEVEDIGIWRDPDDFSPNLKLTTEPDVSSADATVPRKSGVEVTIKSRDENIPIETAYLYYNITNTWHGVPLQGKWEMVEKSATKFYYEIPAQSPEVEVEFYIKAWDINETMIESREFKYTVEEEPEDPEERGQSLINVAVYDAELGRYREDVKVGFGNYSWETYTYTGEDGRCYPNVTGEKYTPQYLTINGTYWVEVYYPHELNNETEDKVRLTYEVKHPHYTNETEVVYDKGNLKVTREPRKNSTPVLVFEYNTPRPPPEFADIYRGYDLYTVVFLAILAGMTIPIGWKLYRLMEQGQKERSLVK